VPAPAEVEEKEVTTPLVEVEAAPAPNAEVVGSNGVSRLERLNSTCFRSEGAGVAILDCRRGGDQVFGSVSAQNSRGIDATAPATKSGLDDVEYYVPEIGHRVIGIVVYGSRTKLYVDMGAAKLGEFKASQLLPLDRFQVKHNKWICPEEVDADGAEEDAAPTSSLGFDALVTEPQSLPVESTLLDVANPVKDVPAITEVHMVANLVVQFAYVR
jgi:hypothetical protein